MYRVFGVNGPVVTIAGATALRMMEMVYVGGSRLIGEVIGLDSNSTTIQVYEESAGLSAGQNVHPTGELMSVTLGPGMLSNIYDGIQRPLKALEDDSGAFIGRGCNLPALDEEKLWDVTIRVKVGDIVRGGDIAAICPETGSIEHRALVPPNLQGKIVEVRENGRYTVCDTLAVLEDGQGNRHHLRLSHKWAIRVPRPVVRRFAPTKPLLTGQRVIDTLLPIAKGGAAAIPGGFGTGKTMTQHQLAKWCDADIIVYIGCGERGNEMTQVLHEFGELVDPKTGRPLSDRTILIANTSNMPVAAREASIYTGITIAEYYRDMGYHIAVMADSTSRWAEALREISGRLEEMPADEGFPAYLPSRLAEFYERGGYVQNANGSEGSITIIGAVSPQGSDFSEPVTQNTKRFTRCFWALDKSLAYARHYPAINWTESYSEYIVPLSAWYDENAGANFLTMRENIMKILLEEDQLLEIVKLIGADVLPDEQKLVLETAKVIRAGFLQQNAFHDVDTYVPLTKQREMMRVILLLHEKGRQLIMRQKPLTELIKTGLFEKLTKMKYEIGNDDMTGFEDLAAKIERV